jgi:hypothetical protein
MENAGHDLCAEDAQIVAERPRSSVRATKASSSEAVVAPPPAGSKMNTVLFIETG